MKEACGGTGHRAGQNRFRSLSIERDGCASEERKARKTWAQAARKRSISVLFN